MRDSIMSLECEPKLSRCQRRFLASSLALTLLNTAGWPCAQLLQHLPCEFQRSKKANFASISLRCTWSQNGYGDDSVIAALILIDMRGFNTA